MSGAEGLDVTRVARDLSAIESLQEALDTQAVHKANDRLMPGGRAMVALSRVASPEAWENVYEAAEARGRDTTYVVDQDEDWTPPLQLLLFWSEAWRVERGRESDRTPTTASEAAFIRACLAWAWLSEPHWADFAADVNLARLRLEEVLYAGKRAQRMRVSCNRCSAEPMLVREYALHEDKLPAPELQHWWHLVDHYRCPNKLCRYRFTEDEYRRVYADQLRSEGAERFVRVQDAVATLRDQGRSERTIRGWFAECRVLGYCDTASHETFAWWPDLWRLHLSTQTRSRAS